MNHLTIRYDLPVGFDTAAVVHYPLAKKMEWSDVFESRDRWKALAKDMGALLVHAERLSAAEGASAEALFVRLEKLNGI